MVNSSFLYMVRCFTTVTEQSRVDTIYAWGVGVARLWEGSSSNIDLSHT